MARLDPNQKLIPSVLDRLIDLEPKVSTEPADQSMQRISQIKAAVKRDLEWLLNTKCTLRLGADDAQLKASLLAYGLPDLTTISLSNPYDRERLRRALREAIARFEPRLHDVEVTLVEGRKEERSLHFRIDGVLDVEPNPEPVSFDSVMQLQNKTFSVQGS